MQSILLKIFSFYSVWFAFLKIQYIYIYISQQNERILQSHNHHMIWQKPTHCHSTYHLNHYQIHTSSSFINSQLTYSLSGTLNKLIVRHYDFTPHIEHYKVIDDTNDSFEQFNLSLRSCVVHQFKLIGCANGLFCLLEKNCFVLWNSSI